MSTELFTHKQYTLTRFWGGKDRGICLQITPEQHPDGGYAQLTADDVKELVVELGKFLEDK